MRCASKDGTSIAFDRAGSGPPIILIDGALTHRATVGPNRSLAERLSEELTVIRFDRRGRGESGDTAPYAVAREIDDVAALIDAAGGSAHVYGISSGGLLALEAAMQLQGHVLTVTVYEIPFVVDDTRPPAPKDFPDRLAELLAAGRRGAAVKLFMRDVARVPSILVGAMPLFPGWSKSKAAAHTLAYDWSVMEGTQAGKPLPADRWTSITVPALVVNGAKSPAWLAHGAAALADALPGARRRTLEGQNHYVKADALAPVLAEFVTSSTSS